MGYSVSLRFRDLLTFVGDIIAKKYANIRYKKSIYVRTSIHCCLDQVIPLEDIYFKFAS